MKFAQWFSEMDQQTPLPDARQFSYIACVLSRQEQKVLEGEVENWISQAFDNKIIDKFKAIPSGWSWRTHHMTVIPPNLMAEDMETCRQFFGEDVPLTITHVGLNENIVAVMVHVQKPLPFKGVAIPHITIAHSRAVMPKDSSNMLMDRKNIHQFSATGLTSVFSAVKKDQTTLWPPERYAMAIPVRVA